MSIESKTKEAILDKLWVALNNRESDPEMQLYLSPDEIDMVHEAMEEYARNRSIEFGAWLSQNYYMDQEGFYHHDYQNKMHYTAFQLYELFSHSIDK